MGRMAALPWAGGAKKDVAASEPQMDLSYLFPLDETTISRPGRPSLAPTKTNALKKCSTLQAKSTLKVDLFSLSLGIGVPTSSLLP